MLVCSARRAVGRHEVVQFAVPLEAAAHMGPRRDPRGVGIAADDGVENRLMLRADQDRKSVVSGKSVSVRVDLGGRRIIKKTHTTKNNRTTIRPRNDKQQQTTTSRVRT